MISNNTGGSLSTTRRGMFDTVSPDERKERAPQHKIRISEKHEIATITPHSCPRGESYLHRNASRRSVAETHHAQRSTGCPDEREKLASLAACRAKTSWRASREYFLSSFSSLSLSLSLCRSVFSVTVNGRRTRGLTRWAARQRRPCSVIFVGREDIIASG